LKIHIITSCTGQKRYKPANQLTQADFELLHKPEIFNDLENQLTDYRLPAAEMYTGLQHTRLMEGINYFQQARPQDEVNLWIVSAGYGLISGEQRIVPYECTFQDMKAKQIHEWSRHLNIPRDLRDVLAKQSDLVIVLLSESYLRALELDAEIMYKSPTLFLVSKNSMRFVKGQGQFFRLVLQIKDTKRFSCGFVGLKGEVTKRLLYYLSTAGTNALDIFSREKKDASKIFKHLIPTR
jgi:hypothetical protein